MPDSELISPKASMEDVAQAAGVSLSTVSRVLTRQGSRSPVAMETAQRVRKIAQQMGYAPQVRRRRTAGGQSDSPTSLKQIAFVVAGSSQLFLEHPFSSKVLSGVVEILKENDKTLTFHEVDPRGQELPELVDRLDASGVLLYAQEQPLGEMIEEAALCKPLVWMLGDTSFPVSVDRVGHDNLAVGRMAASYLHDQGCKSVAMLIHCPRHPAFAVREAGFRLGCRDLGLTSKVLIRNEQMPNGEAIWKPQKLHADFNDMIDELMAGPAVDGIFVASDTQARHVEQVMLQRGLMGKVNWKLVSCDNICLPGMLAMLDWWSIDVSPQRNGRMAVTRLLERIGNPDLEPTTQLIAPLPPDVAG